MEPIQNTPPGLQRFNFFLGQLQQMIDKAEATDNPALSLYQQGVRTPLFMLEALSRLYMNAHEKKPFKKLRDLFKDFEDRLGGVDYYDGFVKEFDTNESIPQVMKDFLKKRRDEKLEELKGMLLDKSWIGADNKRMRKITAKLSKAEWPGAEKDSDGLKEYYRKTISSIINDVEKGEINFDNVEEDVHELRREIRWLSIYPQALRGLMQLKHSTTAPEYITKYLTPEIINSPFNKMPETGGQTDIIHLDSNHFYALSWLIAELGKLKDSGLRIEAVGEALLFADKGLDRQTAEEKATALLGAGQMKMAEILEKSKTISFQFFNEKVLQQLAIE
jgi:hypothetical protein